MGLFTSFFRGKGGKQKQGLVNQLLEQLIEKGGFDISYDIEVSDRKDGGQMFRIDFYGEDEKLFIDRDGSLLDSLQLFIKRSLQHQFPGDVTNVICDCNGFRKKTNQSLMELAERLKKKVIDQGRSVYLRALSPKDRKVVHQFLAEDERVKSQSVGEGLYKKIKIYPNSRKNGHSNP